MRLLKPLVAILALMATGSAASPAPTSRQVSHQVSLQDGRGRTLTMTKAPERIASSSLGSDEILLTLLSQAKQTNRLVALSALVDDPRYSNITTEARQIKGRVGRDLEASLALRPDLIVLANFNTPEILNRLGTLEKPSFVLADFVTLADIVRNIRTLGTLIWLQDQGEQLAAAFEAKLTAYQTKGQALQQHPKVLGFYSDGAVSGSQTIFDDLVRVAGGENLAATAGLKGWPKISAETLATMKPDLLITGGDPATKDKILTNLRQQPGWNKMQAVKSGQLLVIPEQHLGAASQHVLKALHAMQQKFIALEPPKSSKR